MSPFRSFALASLLSLASSVRLVAQAPHDSASLAVAASERALNGRTIARRTIAVLPFSVVSPDTTLVALGYGLAEFLSDDLAHSHRLTMIERIRLPDLEREQTLSLAANFDPATSVRVGRLVAAQHIIVGAIDAPAPDAMTIDERAVQVTTGAIEQQHKATTPVDAIFRAERDLAMQTFAAFGITLTADEKRALYERVAPQFRAFLAFSRGVRAEVQGSDEGAVAAFQEAAALDDKFKLAAKKLSAARLRIAARAASAVPTSAGGKEGSAAKETPEESAKETVKEIPKEQVKSAAGDAANGSDAKLGAPAPVSGSAPGGTAAPSSAESAKPEASSSSSKPQGTSPAKRKSFTPPKHTRPRFAAPRP